MIIPSAIIGGAPKAGTTSLFRWLSDHPDVHGSTPKEPYFLMDPGHPLRGRYSADVEGLEGYERFFPDALPDGFRLEATTHYLFQEMAPEWVARMDPVPLMIFILREPALRARSVFYYGQQVLATISDDVSFPQFVDGLLEGDLRRLEDAARQRSSAMMLARTLEYGCYARHLDRWHRAIGENSILVLLFEDLVRDPKSTVQAVARRACIDPSFYEGYDFEAENRTYVSRSGRLHYWLRRIARRVPDIPIKTWLRDHYFRLMTSPFERGESDRSLERLRTRFEPCNRLLEERYGLDLTPWRSAC